MVHKSKVVRGIANFVDSEILSKLRGSLQAWIVGGVMLLIIPKVDAIITKLSENDIVKSMGVIDGELINIDELYKAFRAQAEKAEAVIDLPMVGAIKLGVNDVDRLYRLIQEA